MFSQADLSQTLRRIPWFNELGQTHLDRLVSIATTANFEAGEYLFHEGDREDSLYVLLEGQVALEIEVPTRGRSTIYVAETLDVIGWSSLTPIVRQRTASARVVKPSALIQFNSKLLQQACEEDCELGYVVMKRLANLVANRLLTTRLCLFDMLAQSSPEESGIV